MADFLSVVTWARVLYLLPRDLNSLAKATGSVARWREVANGEVLAPACASHPSFVPKPRK